MNSGSAAVQWQYLIQDAVGQPPEQGTSLGKILLSMLHGFDEFWKLVRQKGLATLEVTSQAAMPPYGACGVVMLFDPAAMPLAEVQGPMAYSCVRVESTVSVMLPPRQATAPSTAPSCRRCPSSRRRRRTSSEVRLRYVAWREQHQLNYPIVC